MFHFYSLQLKNFAPFSLFNFCYVLLHFFIPYVHLKLSNINFCFSFLSKFKFSSFRYHLPFQFSVFSQFFIYLFLFNNIPSAFLGSHWFAYISDMHCNSSLGIRKLTIQLGITLRKKFGIFFISSFSF